VSRPLDEKPHDKQGYDRSKGCRNDGMPWVKRQQMTPSIRLVVSFDTNYHKGQIFTKFLQIYCLTRAMVCGFLYAILLYMNYDIQILAKENGVA
jgi:hypothetical protein